MEAFVEDLDRSGRKASPRKVLRLPRGARTGVGAHPNRRYFIFKTIILNNLFGVDIMEEAVEICKLRLFLKLAAQVEPDAAKDNLGIEPLPDIDFNIRAGNTLVGYATADEVRRVFREKPSGKQVQYNLMLGDKQDAYARFDDQVKIADSAFRQFRDMQTQHGMDAKDFAGAKQTLRSRLKSLEDELNQYLAGEYGVPLSGRSGRKTKEDSAAYEKWLKSHQPFHWFIEFYGIMQSGGFDVIIGNPPWKEYAAVKKEYTVRNYAAEACGNLYGLSTERSFQLLSANGFFSFIVQLPVISSSRMIALRNLLKQNADFVNAIPCDDRPGKLFDGLQNCRSTILVAKKTGKRSDFQLSITPYNRWATIAREHLFKGLSFTTVDGKLLKGQFPKVASRLHLSVFSKTFDNPKHTVAKLLSSRPANSYIFYQEATRYWIKATIGLPYYAKNGQMGAPAHGRYFYFDTEDTTRVCFALMNSSLFYSYFIAYGDCFHLSDALAMNFPISQDIICDKEIIELSKRLQVDLDKYSERKSIATKSGDEIEYAEFKVSNSKPLIDKIDNCLAEHLGFTGEELDFIINYDIKYRMGRDAGVEEG